MRVRPLACSLLLGGTLAAHADTLQTLYVNATLQSGDIIAGTLTYDLDGYHRIVGGNVTSTGLYNLTWTQAGSSPNLHGTGSIYMYNGDSSDLIGPDFDLEYATGLYVPFQPITICSLTNPCQNYFTGVSGGYDYSQISNLPAGAAPDIAVSGYVTSIAPTPEPSAFVLLGTGLLGLTSVLRKRAGHPPLL